MKKLKLSPEAEYSLSLLNKLYGDEESILYDCYDKASKFETDLFDAGLFVDEAYADNVFGTLEELAKNISEEEFKEEFREEGIELTIKRLNRMIKNNILIVEEIIQD